MRIKQSDLIYMQFYKIPKELVKNEVFNNISIGAKLLYGVMIDRAELSIKNGWINENGEIFVYYKLEEITQNLGVSKQTAINYLKELEENELIEKEKGGFNKPNKYYLSTIVYNLDHNSLKIRPHESKKLTTEVYFLDPNNTEYNNTEYNKKENIKRKYFEEEELNELFIEFLQMRKKMKAINSERAINTLLNILDKYDLATKKEMINNSIVNSWKSVYELKQGKKKRNEIVYETI